MRSGGGAGGFCGTATWREQWRPTLCVPPASWAGQEPSPCLTGLEQHWSSQRAKAEASRGSGEIAFDFLLSSELVVSSQEPLACWAHRECCVGSRSGLKKGTWASAARVGSAQQQQCADCCQHQVSICVELMVVLVVIFCARMPDHSGTGYSFHLWLTLAKS